MARKLQARGRLLKDGKIAVVTDVSALCQCDCGEYFNRLDFLLHTRTCEKRLRRRGSR